MFIGVNTLFNAMVNRPDFAEVDFSRLKLTLGGGMATQKPWRKNGKKLPVRRLWKLTVDRSQPGRMLQSLEYRGLQRRHRFAGSFDRSRIARCGRQKKYLSDSRAVWVRGPQVMKGYWNRPEETAKAIDARGFGDRRYCRDG